MRYPQRLLPGGFDRELGAHRVPGDHELQHTELLQGAEEVGGLLGHGQRFPRPGGSAEAGESIEYVSTDPASNPWSRRK